MLQKYDVQGTFSELSWRDGSTKYSAGFHGWFLHDSATGFLRGLFRDAGYDDRKCSLVQGIMKERLLRFFKLYDWVPGPRPQVTFPMTVYDPARHMPQGCQFGYPPRNPEKDFAAVHGQCVYIPWYLVYTLDQESEQLELGGRASGQSFDGPWSGEWTSPEFDDPQHGRVQLTLRHLGEEEGAMMFTAWQDLKTPVRVGEALRELLATGRVTICKP